MANVQTQSASWIAHDADTQTLLAALEVDAKTFLAGPITEGKYRSSSVTKRTGWRADIDNAETYVRKFVMLRRNGVRPSKEDIQYTFDDDASAECYSVWDRLNKETNTLVYENWPAIERVAAALLKSRVLNSSEIDELIAGVYLPRTMS